MKERKNIVNIGIISFITMFIILCFSTFAVLSLVSANSSAKTSEKSVLYKKEFYSLNNAGNTFLKEIDTKLYQLYESSNTESSYYSQLIQLQDAYENIKIENNMITYIIKEDNQQLYIQLKVVYPGETLYEIETWKIESNKEWNPEQGLNIL